MTAQTLTLADFLLARISEDEASVRPWSRGVLDPDVSNIERRYQAPRVLAECAAKRQIVEDCRPVAEHWDYYETDDAPDLADNVLRIMAQPYADHPDFRQEWRVS